MVNSMNHRFFKFFMFVSGSLTIGATSSSAESYVLKIAGVPARQGASCFDQAALEAQRLKEFVSPKFGSIELAHSECVDGSSDIPNQWNFNIFYRAPQVLPLVSTIESRVIERPGYASKKDCELALAHDSAVFSEKTSLPVFMSYCKTPDFSDLPWESAIIGFGSPEIRPFSASVNLMGTVLGHNRNSFTGLIRQNLESLGIAMAQADVFNHLAYFTLAFRYYGPEQMLLEEAPIAKFKNKQDCLNSVGTAHEAVGASGIMSIATYCHSDTTTQYAAELVTITEQLNGPNLVTSDIKFDTETACQSARPGIEAHFRNDLNYDVKASFCSFNTETKKISVTMLYKK